MKHNTTASRLPSRTYTCLPADISEAEKHEPLLRRPITSQEKSFLPKRMGMHAYKNMQPCSLHSQPRCVQGTGRGKSMKQYFGYWKACSPEFRAARILTIRTWKQCNHPTGTNCHVGLRKQQSKLQDLLACLGSISTTRGGGGGGGGVHEKKHNIMCLQTTQDERMPGSRALAKAEPTRYPCP